MTTGRNDPCPCGSGIKFKKCCADKDNTAAEPTGTKVVMDELRGLLENGQFPSLQEANAFLTQFMQRRNQAPIDDFHGLSSEQMHRLLYFPLDTPSLVTFPTRLDVTPQAPIVTLFDLLAAAIGEDGLKATATGNLPRNFCREAAQVFLGEELYKSRYGELRGEADFTRMHVTRVVSELAGLVRKYKGKFILSKQCRKLLAVGTPAVYPQLLRTFVTRYNWGYQDLYDELPFIQQSFLFSLYLLKKYGGDWRSNGFYEDCFLHAFPNVLSQVQPRSYSSQEDQLRRCYSIRCLERFASFVGLAEIDCSGSGRFSRDFQIRKTPLLEHAVRFSI